MGNFGKTCGITALLVLISFSSVLTAPAPAIKPSEISVVIDDNYPPFAFREKSGELVGISIDQWKLWEQKTGIKVNIEGMDWNSAQLRMAEGKRMLLTPCLLQMKGKRDTFSPLPMP